MKILKRKDKIIFSESLIWELKKDYNNKIINDMLNLLFVNKILVKIDITNKEYREAKKLSEERKMPFVDCLNAIQARNHDAIMVSQDKHFREFLSDIVTVAKP